MAPITSRLVKSALLMTESKYFSQLVKAAAVYTGIQNTEHLLNWMATRQNIVDAITLDEGSAIDVEIRKAMVNNGTALDNIIITQINTYTAPVSS